MAVRTRTQLKGDADSYLPDNTSGQISPEDVRERVKDLADSAIFAEDGPFSMDNMDEGADTKIMTAAERAAISSNTAARHTHSNKAILDGTQQSFTTVLKNKLDGIAAGADVSVNPDWNATSGKAQVLNKPTLGTASAANVGDFATATQGSKADTAVQPGDLSGFATTAQLTAGLSGKFNNPTGTTAQYIRGDGSLATFPAIPAGTVTSVGMSVPPGFSVSGSPITGAGTFAVTYASGYQGYTTAEANKLAGIAAGAQVNTVTSVAGKTGAVTLAKGDVGLGNVDNTSDASKPVSSAQAAAINAKADPPASGSTTSAATITPPGGSVWNQYFVTAQAAAATIAAPSGTAANGNRLILRIKDNGTARALTWNAIYRGVVDALPATTTTGKTLYCGFIYNSADSKWDMIAMAQEA